jgi:NAD(P)-dependent dehydrogenase (short-subunit alcohol dehydrogenase family)
MDKSSAFPKRWTFADIPDQSGRSAVVTGASSGLGLVVAEELASHGAHVVMAVRDLAKGERVRAELVGRHPTAALQLRHLDLADLDSVNRFADELGSQFQSLDLLVNNAGMGGGPRRLSPQNYELTWATDFLGPFALTGRLLPVLETGHEPRIVTVASNFYKRMKVTLPLDDPRAERSFSSAKAYIAAKTADLVFAVELERRLRAHGSSLRSLAAHPGVAKRPCNKVPPRCRSGSSRSCSASPWDAHRRPGRCRCSMRPWPRTRPQAGSSAPRSANATNASTQTKWWPRPTTRRWRAGCGASARS